MEVHVVKSLQDYSCGLSKGSVFTLDEVLCPNVVNKAYSNTLP